MGTIDDYLAGLEDADASIIGHLYDVAREVAPEAEQGLGYGMPALVYRGKSLLSIMRAKKHFGVYPFSPAAIVEIARPPGRNRYGEGHHPLHAGEAAARRHHARTGDGA